MEATDRRLQIIAAGLWAPERFVTQPGVGPQLVERKIFRPFRELNFVNMDGFSAMPH